MLAIQVWYGGVWQHGEAVEGELEAHRVARAYRNEHGVPVRIVTMETGYETVWRPSGRSDRDRSLLAVSPTKGGGDPRHEPVLLRRHLRDAGA